jgi:hypothetical protein
LKEGAIFRRAPTLITRNIFGPYRDEMVGGWSNLRKGELHNLYSSSNVIRMIESRKMRWAWHVACDGKKKKRIGFLIESQKERDH